MINILFDGRIFEYAIVSNQSRTGIYWVAKNILLELLNRNDVNVSLYFPKKNEELNRIFEDLNIKSLNILSDCSDLSNINSYICSFGVPPEFNNYPNISKYTVLYDIICLLYPEYFNPDMINIYMQPLINSFNIDKYYFAISDSTKNNFLKYFENINQNNIKTIPLSTNIKYNLNKDDNQLKRIYKKYNIPLCKKYLFSLCSLEPRKNLIRAVKNYIYFIKKHKINDLVYVLGGNAWQGFVEKLEKEVPEYEQYKDKIIRAGYVDDEDLEILYSNAEWFVYTSQYEGFGMPPLEAMACGCPVITSNNSSLPEVVGDAGIMIDYDNDEQHIQAYEKYYFDENYRNEMAQKGLERSKLFSWEKTVDIILNKMYEVEERKKQQPLVTIITPTFNLIKGGRKDWFIQNLESVRNQTYSNIEHIVIDGASTDGTLELLEDYQKKGWITYYSEPDKGIYDALNKGILKAKGKYVVCLNSDDFYCENKAVEWLVSKAEETSADACCAGAKSIQPDTCKIAGLWSVYQTDNLLFGEMACHQTFLIKTNVMKELGLYDLQYKVSSDTAFMYKMLNNNKKFVFIEPLIVNYRLGGLSFDTDKVKNEVSKSLFENYGRYHQITQYQANLLNSYNYLNLPLHEAINLGSKLIYTQKSEWIEEYFRRLIDYVLNQNNKNCNNPVILEKNICSKDAINYLVQKIFSLKNQYINNKKYKVITFLGIKLKIKIKCKQLVF